MKQIYILILLAGFVFSRTSFAESVVNCVSGSRSMTVIKEKDKLVGTLKDNGLNLSKMKCGTIPDTKTIRCDKGDYYVVIFESEATKKLVVQVNLKGDFGPEDSGYLHTLDCE